MPVPIPSMENHVTLDPSQDGITHLNVYSKGKTPLGRFLSNFAHTPIETMDGHFESVEGYIYWLVSEGSPDREQLRSVYGFAAKKLGRRLSTLDFGNVPKGFTGKVCMAITTKVLRNREMLNQLQANTLPLTHYYVMWGKVIDPNNFGWTCEHLLWLAGQAAPQAVAA